MIIDESTDISVTQIFVAVIRYFDLSKQDVTDELLDTVTVESGTARSLYYGIKTLFNERQIPLKNVIGFGSDNCSTMMGSKSVFQKLMSQEVPSLFVIGCISHSFALCANHAVSVLPPFVETFLRDVSAYFYRSGKREREFMLIQDVTSTPNHSIPKLAQTRWLSRVTVISVILEQ